MLRHTQSFLPQALSKATKKSPSNHKANIYPFREIKYEPLSESEEEFFLTLQSRLPVLTIQ
jgi:hypothetical protein